MYPERSRMMATTPAAPTASLSAPAETVTALRSTIDTPQTLDLAVIATRDPEWTTRGRLALRLTAEDGQPLGRAYVFNGAWYPGRDHSVPFSHYLPALERAYEGLEQGGRPASL